MEPIRSISEQSARVAVGTGSPSFAANCVSPQPGPGHLFPGLSFLSSKIKGLQDLSSLTFPGSDSRGSSSLFITT